jgi:hypothetical protein
LMLDVGVARVVQSYLRTEFAREASVVYVPYRDPHQVGLCHRIDATVWSQFCQAAYEDLLKQLRTTHRASWVTTVNSVSNLKLVPAAVEGLAV